MNKDLKVGLAVMLLLLVGLFVFFAWRSSGKDQPAATGDGGTEVAKGPEKTSGTPPPEKKKRSSFIEDYLKLDPSTRKGESVTDLTMKGTGKKTEDPVIVEIDPDATREDPGTFVDPGVVTPVPPPGIGSVTPPGSYVVKPGDVLGEISKKVYGSPKHWQLIAAANRIVDPATEVHAGMVLQIPPLPAAERVAVGPGLPAPPAGGQIHVVAESDTLSQISDKYYGTMKHWRIIAQANNLAESDLLRVGSRLVIPPLPEGTVVVAPERLAPGAGEQEYVVKEGDTLQEISEQFYGTVRYHEFIQKANNISDPRSLRAGQRLIIPAKPAGAAPAGRETLEPRLDPGERRYVVQASDTLSEIASRELGSRTHYPEIMRRNGMTNARELREGQVLILPSLSALRRASAAVPE